MRVYYKLLRSGDGTGRSRRAELDPPRASARGKNCHDERIDAGSADPSATAPTAPSSGPRPRSSARARAAACPPSSGRMPRLRGEARRDPARPTRRLRRARASTDARFFDTRRPIAPPARTRGRAARSTGVLWVCALRSSGGLGELEHGQAGHGSPLPCAASGARGHPRRVPLPGRHPRFPKSWLPSMNSPSTTSATPPFPSPTPRARHGYLMEPPVAAPSTHRTPARFP